MRTKLSKVADTKAWMRRISLVLIFTMLFSTIIYQRWYGPNEAQAAISRPTNWTSQYAQAGYPAGTVGTNFSIAAGINRLLVVAIASTRTAAGAQTVSNVTWNGQALTLAAGDGGSTATWNHTYLYYLKDANMPAGTTAAPLQVTITGGTAYYTTVHAAVYAGVDQATPFTDAKNWNSTAADAAVGPTGLSIANNDQAITVVNLARSTTGTTGRTIGTWATEWNTAGVASGLIITNGPCFQSYVRDRNVLTATTDNSTHTASSANTWDSMTAMSIKAAVTTLGGGTNPGAITIAPGSAITDLNSFTFQTGSAGTTDLVTALTVTLPAGTAAGLSEVRITSDNGATTYFNAIANPASDTLNFSGGTSIPVTNTLTQFKVRITPASHANMPARPGSSYAVMGKVTAFTSSNIQAGSDAGSNIITIDNTSPANVNGVTGSAGNNQVTLNWTNPGGDFSKVVIFRWPTGTTFDSIVEGATYTQGTGNGLPQGNNVIYVGAGITWDDETAVNGTAYTYKIFSQDTSGNYSQGIETGPYTPVIPDITIPTVNTFTATSPATSLTISIPAFTASDNVGVTGYKITSSSTPPAAGAAGWLASAPTTTTVSADGTYTLYPWAKDAAGNVSSVYGSPQTVLVDTTAPAGLAASTPADAATDQPLNVRLQSTTATDSGSGNVQYYFDVTDTDVYAQNSGWTSNNYFDPPGMTSGVTYAWKVKARDAAGNETGYTTPRSFTTTDACYRNDPTLTLAPQSSTISSDNGTANYTLTVKNNDYGSCGSTVFALTAEDNDTADKFAVPVVSMPTVTLASGATTTVTLTVRAETGKTSGQCRTGAVSAADANHGIVDSNTVTTTINVVGCTLNTPLLIIGPDEENVAINGSVTYTVAIKNTDAGTGCAPATFTPSIVSENNVPSDHFNPSTFSIPSILLSSGQSGTVGLIVSAKSGATTDQVNVTTIGLSAPGHASPANAVATTTVGNRLLHNSINIDSVKWAGSGGWGVPGGKYGEFTCTTCHTTGSSGNIKKVRQTITTPDTSKGTLPGDGVNVVFTRTSGTAGVSTGVMGDDSNTPRASSNRICEVCHTYDATGVNGVNTHPYAVGSALANHQSMNAGDCITCHEHKKGFKGSGDCTGCHGPGNTPTATPSLFWSDDGSWSNYGKAGNSPGAHVAHYGLDAWYTLAYDDSNLSTAEYTRYNCRKCHEAGHSAANTPNITLVSTKNPPSGGTYNNTTDQCSSVYCHGNFTGGNAANTPAWNSPATGACGTCHGSSAAAPPSGGSHPRHVGSAAGQLSLDCSNCHQGTGTNTTIIDKNRHVSGEVNVDMKRENSMIGSAATYNGLEVSLKSPPSATYGNCSMIYCHSNVQSATGGARVAGDYKTVTWGGGVLACNGCHGNPPASGSHATTSHVTTCTSCHDNPSGSTHSNGAINVAGVGYSGDTIPENSNFSTCSTASCHASAYVAGTMVVTPVWGSTGNGCSICHPMDAATGAPATGTHNKHMAVSSIQCNTCHDGAVKDVNGGTQHVDGDIDVTNGYPANVAKHLAGSGYSACGNIYCHSNGKGAYVPPTWGATSPGCTYCHPTLSGKHSSHVVFSNTSTYGGTAANVTGSTTNYDFGCGNCHPTNALKHMDGVIDLSLSAADGGTLKSRNSSPSIVGSGLTTQCNGVYCHSDGKAAPVFVQTPQWQNAYASAFTTCSNCHGNSPAGANHAAHVVGIHYDNNYTGTTGLATAGNGASNSHGNSSYSTTINCNICHSGTVTKSRNKYGTTCNTASCHSGDADNATNTMVTADIIKTTHVNGQPDVVFPAASFKSKEQLRDDITTVAELNNNWTRNANSYKAGATPNDTTRNALNSAAWTSGSKTCSNIACHNGNSVVWTSTTVSCSSCHTALPK